MSFLSSVRRASLAGAFLLGLSALPSHAATFTVSNLNDSGPGSLRQALTSANAKADADTIVFKSGLSGTIPFKAGEIVISHDVTLNGPTNRDLILQGNGTTRLFTVQNATVSMSNLTLKGGNLVGATGIGTTGASVYGGALYNAGTLTLSNLTFSGNTIVGGTGGIERRGKGGDGGEARGGAVFNVGALTLSGVAFQNNSATGGAGRESSQSGGSVGLPGKGGNALGGALYNGGTLKQSNVTFAGNTVAGGEGSWDATGLGPNIRDVRPVAQSATFTLIQNQYESHALVATGDFVTYSLVSGTLPDGLTLSAYGSLSGTPTQAAKNLKLTYRVSDGYRTSNTATITLSIVPAEQSSLVVTTLSDNSTNVDGVTSLREALAYALTLDDNQTISFDLPTSTESTLTLAQGPLLAQGNSGASNSHVTVDWAGPELLTLQNNGGRLLSVSNSILLLNRFKFTGANGTDSAIYTDPGGTLSLTNCTLSSNAAGAILNEGVINMTTCLVSDNRSSAIRSSGGLIIDSSTLSNNTGTNGGAINASSLVELTNTTLYGNSASGDGGAIYLGARTGFSFDSCTITSNSAMSSKGRGSFASVNEYYGYIINCLIAGNTGNKGQHLDEVSLNSNISVQTSILRGTARSAGLQTDRSGVPLLKDNGGPTPTVALLSSSPAIDAGQTSVSTDQRDFPRPQGSAADIGAYERQPTALSVQDIRVQEGNSGITNAVFTVVLLNPSSQAVTVKYATQGASQNSAAAGSDYTAASGTLTFSPGQTSRTVTVQIKGDTFVEPNESFVLKLTDPQGATIADPTALCTILNDDSPPKSPALSGSAPTS